jgi:PAC2 family protein
MAGLYELHGAADSPLVAPVIVAAFDGWIDAAGASTASTTLLATDSEPVATFDGDVLFDFRSRRPVLDIVDGNLEEVTWPQLSLARVRLGERDVLVLSGAEPDFRWKQLAAAILELCLRLGVVEWVSLGAIPAAVPHTRPVPILGSESRPGLLREQEQRPDGLLRVPSAALSVIELAVSGNGVPAVGFYAQVPHYVGGPYAAASIALLERLQRQIGVPVPMDDLLVEAATQRERLDELLAERPDTKSYVEQLESAVDDDRVPSGDELAAEIERFLQESGGGDGGPSNLGE